MEKYMQTTILQAIITNYIAHRTCAVGFLRELLAVTA